MSACFKFAWSKEFSHAQRMKKMGLYSLVQWNWFSDVCRMHAAAQCTCAAIVTDGQRSNFTVPGCTSFVDQSFVSGHIRHLSTVPAYAQALLCRCFWQNCGKGVSDATNRSGGVNGYEYRTCQVEECAFGWVAARIATNLCLAEEETPSRSMHLGRVSQLNDMLAKLLRHQQNYSSSTEIATKSRQTKVSRDSSSSKQFSLFSHSTHHPQCQQGWQLCLTLKPISCSPSSVMVH